MVDFNKKIKNSAKFLQAALFFKEHNCYTLAPRGTTDYTQYWDQETERCIPITFKFGISETGWGNYYMYGKGSRTYNKSDAAYTGTENPLSVSVDTARQVWGGLWHQPTKAQIEELIARTTFSWTTISSVAGAKFTASNGRYVFLPASGAYVTDGTFSGTGSQSRYWANAPDSSDIAKASIIHAQSGQAKFFSRNRKYGLPVRGVVG